MFWVIIVKIIHGTILIISAYTCYKAIVCGYMFLKTCKLYIFNVKNYFIIIIVLDIAGLLETDLIFDNTLEYTKCTISYIIKR